MPTVNLALGIEVSGNLVRVSEKMVSCSFVERYPESVPGSTFPFSLNPAFSGEFNSHGSDGLVHHSSQEGCLVNLVSAHENFPAQIWLPLAGI